MEPPLCEHTIRKCIAELLSKDPEAYEPAAFVLTDLLPKKDRAKSLAEEFQSWFCHSGQTLNETRIAADTAEAFARWLINEKGAL